MTKHRTLPLRRVFFCFLLVAFGCFALSVKEASARPITLPDGRVIETLELPFAELFAMIKKFEAPGAKEKERDVAKQIRAACQAEEYKAAQPSARPATHQADQSSQQSHAASRAPQPAQGHKESKAPQLAPRQGKGSQPSSAPLLAPRKGREPQPRSAPQLAARPKQTSPLLSDIIASQSPSISASKSPSPARGLIPVITVGGASPPLLIDPEGLVVDNRSQGDSLFVADKVRGRIYRFIKKGVEVYAGNGKSYKLEITKTYRPEYEGADPKEIPLPGMGGIAQGPDGSLYINDWDADRIWRITPDGKQIYTFTTPAAYSHTGGEIDVAPDGTVFIADMHSVRMVKDGVTTVVAGGRWKHRFPWDSTEEEVTRCQEELRAETERRRSIKWVKPSSPTQYDFLDISAIKLLPNDGGLLIADEEGYVFKLKGNDLSIFAGNKEGRDDLDGIDPKEAKLLFPGIMAIGPDESVYLTTRRLKRIRKIKNGIITTVGGGENDQAFEGDESGTQCHCQSCSTPHQSSDKHEYSADGVCTERSWFHCINAMAAGHRGLFILDWPKVRFLPWDPSAEKYAQFLRETPHKVAPKLDADTLNKWLRSVPLIRQQSDAFQPFDDYGAKPNELIALKDAQYTLHYIQLLDMFSHQLLQQVNISHYWETPFRLSQFANFLSNKVTEPMVRSARPDLAEIDGEFRAWVREMTAEVWASIQHESCEDCEHCRKFKTSLKTTGEEPKS